MGVISDHGHEPGGLIEVTRSPNVLKRWILSLHLCSRLVKDITEMKTLNHKMSYSILKNHEVELHLM